MYTQQTTFPATGEAPIEGLRRIHDGPRYGVGNYDGPAASPDTDDASTKSINGSVISESYVTTTVATEHERRAHQLKAEAEEALRNNQLEFARAEHAQEEARLAAERANALTMKALNNQERGQELLAEAGEGFCC